MKDNYPELNFDMEHLLLNKKYEDLTPDELNEIKDFISSKEDFMLMQNTFVNVKHSMAAEEEIVPSVDTKDKLMQAFEEKHGKVVSINRKPFYLQPFFQVGVAAAVILGIIFFYPSNDSSSDNVTAMNETNMEDKEGDLSKDKGPLVEEAEATAEESPLTSDVVKEAELDGKEIMDASDNTVATTINERAVVGNASAISITTDDVAEESEKALADEVTILSKTSNDKAAKKDASKGVDFKREEAAVPAGENSKNRDADNSFAGVISKENAEEKKKEKDKKADYNVRTNTMGGHYYQPAEPAKDLKAGVSMAEKPELTAFLFTAL